MAWLRRLPLGVYVCGFRSVLRSGRGKPMIFKIKNIRQSSDNQQQNFFQMWATFGTCAIILVAVTLRSFFPDGLDYTKGFAPTWITCLAAILGIIVIFLEMSWLHVQLMPRLLVLIIAWGACVFLIWSSAGIVFDIFRTAAVLGIPGLPPIVDWLGFLTRTVNLIGAILLASSTISFQRISRGACIVCGYGPLTKTQSNRWLGYTAFVLSFPYPLLKIYWSFGGTLGGGQNFGHHTAYGETLLFSANALLSLALVQKWGRTFPLWMPFLAGKKFPRWIPITGGWIATCMIAPMGFLAIFGTFMQILGFTDGPVPFDSNTLMVFIVYGNWLLLGASIGGATWFYQQQTRATCKRCGK